MTGPTIFPDREDQGRSVNTSHPDKVGRLSAAKRADAQANDVVARAAMPGLTPVGEVLRRHGRLQIFYCRMLVAEQPDLSGKHQRQILPEHGPGAIVRTARQPASRRGAPAAVPRTASPTSRFATSRFTEP